MEIGSNIRNSTIVNSNGEFNKGNVKDNKVKDTLNDNSVFLISDDSDAEKVLPQISVITRKTLLMRAKNFLIGFIMVFYIGLS